MSYSYFILGVLTLGFSRGNKTTEDILKFINNPVYDNSKELL